MIHWMITTQRITAYDFTKQSPTIYDVKNHDQKNLHGCQKAAKSAKL